MDRGGRFVRPVSQERKSPKVRGQSGRTPSRGITRGAAQPYGRRDATRSGFFSRLSRFLRGLFDFSRPMTTLTLAVLLLTGIAAFFASGIPGRTLRPAGGIIAGDTGFGIAQVHLTGNVRTTPAAIMAALGFRAGQPIFGIDLRAARARLMQLPWVADAEVKRRYPDDIGITIVERVPYARWQSPEGLFVVEKNGRPITAEGADTFTALPLVAGDGAAAKAAPLIDLVAQYHAIAARVTAYQYQSERRWNLLLNDGVVVKLPETGWKQQLDVLARLIVDKGVLESDIQEIDLRSPTHYFFVRRSAAPDKDKKTESGSSI
jgi:cell division protein FtsQ